MRTLRTGQTPYTAWKLPAKNRNSSETLLPLMPAAVPSTLVPNSWPQGECWSGLEGCCRSQVLYSGAGECPSSALVCAGVGRTTTRFAFRKERIGLCCSTLGGRKEKSVIYTHHELIRCLCLILIPQIFPTSKNNCKNTKNKWETDCNKQFSFKRPQTQNLYFVLVQRTEM